jgi:hypothetical protein
VGDVGTTSGFSAQLGQSGKTARNSSSRTSIVAGTFRQAQHLRGIPVPSSRSNTCSDKGSRQFGRQQIALRCRVRVGDDQVVSADSHQAAEFGHRAKQLDACLREARSISRRLDKLTDRLVVADAPAAVRQHQLDAEQALRRLAHELAAQEHTRKRRAHQALRQTKRR